MLAERTKKHYISITMLNLSIPSILFTLSLLASALRLRKLFALRAAVSSSQAQRTQHLR